MSKYNTSTSIIFTFNAGKCHYNAGKTPFNAGKSRDNASTGIIITNLMLVRGEIIRVLGLLKRIRYEY